MNIIKVKEFKVISSFELRPHPDALAMIAAIDDRAVLSASIGCVGILEPLMVVENTAGSGYLVIDGIGRLEDGGEKVRDLPCLVVECDLVRTFVGHKNAMGRKRSTGSRLLSFLLANGESVRAAFKRESGIHGVYGTLSKEYHPEWSSRGIAARLKVSKLDVQLAITLMMCMQDGIGPDGEELDLKKGNDLEKVFNAVLGATLPIRRWKAAFAGSLTGTQPGESGQAQTNYGAVMQRSITSLGSAWEKWPEISMDEATKAQVHGAFRSMVQNAPEAMRHTAALGIIHWPEAELKALHKKIAKKLSDMA